MLSISIYNIIIGYHGINVQKKMCTNSYVFFFQTLLCDWLEKERERERERDRKKEREKERDIVHIFQFWHYF